MATVKQLLAKIQKTHDQRASVVKQLRKEQAALKKAGISYGSPHYKQGKYLRIVKPSKAGEKRGFDYIGADPEKQQAALDALERGRQYDELEEQAQAVQASMAALENSLSHVVRELEWSQKAAAGSW
jgi:hypothetical protein